MKEPQPAASQAISNETFGMLLVLIAEVMFFAGLVSAYVVLRTGASEWRPPGLPPLARGLSVSNTVLLCASGGTMLLAWLAVRRDDRPALKMHLGLTMLLGLTFVGIQVYELQRLLESVPFSGNVFGGTFYLLTGLHGIHVLGGVAILAFVFGRAWRGKYTRARSTGVIVASLYWYFVVVVWIFLFIALYVL